MAACDNLYGTEKQWSELRDFLFENYPRALVFMNPRPLFLKPIEECEYPDDAESRICYIADIQEWLLENCPFDWVQEKLNDNFNIQRLICGKAHHE